MKTKVAILTSADDVADARLHRLSNALVNAGFSVEVRALGEIKNAPSVFPHKNSIKPINIVYVYLGE